MAIWRAGVSKIRAGFLWKQMTIAGVSPVLAADFALQLVRSARHSQQTFKPLVRQRLPLEQDVSVSGQGSVSCVGSGMFGVTFSRFARRQPALSQRTPWSRPRPSRSTRKGSAMRACGLCGSACEVIAPTIRTLRAPVERGWPRPRREPEHCRRISPSLRPTPGASPRR